MRGPVHADPDTDIIAAEREPKSRMQDENGENATRGEGNKEEYEDKRALIASHLTFTFQGELLIGLAKVPLNYYFMKVPSLIERIDAEGGDAGIGCHAKSLSSPTWPGSSGAQVIVILQLLIDLYTNITCKT